MLAHKQGVQCGKANKNVCPVVAGNHILVVVNGRKDTAAQNVRFHEATLAEQELVTTAAAVNLKKIQFKNNSNNF